jgi:hypothetical protein
MGAYTLVTRPKAKTDVLVKWANGTVTRQRVYRFAFKPSWSRSAYNREMEFRLIWPCRNAFDSSKSKPEEFGVWASDWTPGTPLVSTEPNTVFRTRGHVSLCDESIGGHYPSVGETMAEPPYVEAEPSKMWAKPLEQTEIIFS